jgi:hypothetical protein
VNRRMLWLLGTLVLAGATVRAEPAGPTVYERSERQRHLVGALDALNLVDRATLVDVYRYIHVVERNQCQAPLESLKVGCLLEAARRNCRQRARDRRAACHVISDVIITNQLSAENFVPRRVRYHIMRDYSDYQPALRRELRRRHAVLAVEFRLAAGERGNSHRSVVLAAAVDDYCRAFARDHHLSWQHCAAALVWFVATSHRQLEESL